MNDFAHRFVTRLQALQTADRGALAALRRSLGHEPGSYPPAFPVVEPFAAQDGTREAGRRALYLVAGLFALNPRHRPGTSLAAALAHARQARKSESIEKRFIALLSTDAQGLPVHLRHAATLLAADEAGYDHAQLLTDLEPLLAPWATDAADRVRQRWARDFYRHAGDADTPAPVAEPAE